MMKRMTERQPQRILWRVLQNSDDVQPRILPLDSAIGRHRIERKRGAKNRKPLRDRHSWQNIIWLRCKFSCRVDDEIVYAHLWIVGNIQSTKAMVHE